MQVQSGLQTVAAVVAWTCRNPNAPSVWRNGQGQLGACQTSTLHQWLRAKGLEF
jgi:hypothetical protein